MNAAVKLIKLTDLPPKSESHQTEAKPNQAKTISRSVGRLVGQFKNYSCILLYMYNSSKTYKRYYYRARNWVSSFRHFGSCHGQPDGCWRRSQAGDKVREHLRWGNKKRTLSLTLPRNLLHSFGFGRLNADREFIFQVLRMSPVFARGFFSFSCFPISGI